MPYFSDDGGTAPWQQDYSTPTPLQTQTPSQDTLPEVTVTGQSPVAYSSNPFAIGDDDGLNPVSSTTVGTQAGQKMATSGSSSGSGSGSSAASAASGGALGALLKALGLGGSSGTSSALTGLAGLLSAAGQYSQNKAMTPTFNPPALFNGSAGSSGTGSAGASGGTQYGPAGGYNYSNYQGLTAGSPGTGYAPRTQANPMIPNYYTYGQGPQASFFTSSQSSPTATMPTSMKRGGRVTTPQRFAMAGPVGLQSPGQATLPPINPGINTTSVLPTSNAAPTAMQAPLARPTAPAGLPTMGGTAPKTGMPTMGTQPVRPQFGRPMMRASGGATSGTKASTGNGLASWLQNARTAVPPGRSPVMVGPTPGGPGLAGGGALAAVSRHVKGPGDGTSDDIPARLANGEYVMDAQTVSMLGNGDNGAGAKKFDQFRENLRKHKGAALAKGKMAPDAKEPEQYLPKGEQ